MLTSFLLAPMALLAQTDSPKMLLDNPYVRVVERLEASRTGRPSGEARADRVLVYLPQGEVVFLPAGGTAPPSATPRRIIEIELKRAPGRTPVDAGPLDPVKVDPAHYKVEIDNGRVRVMRARYGPGESGALHQHARDRVTILLTACELEIVAPDGARQVLRGKPFDVAWGTVSRHQEKNLANAVFEVIAVEMKSR